MVGLELPVLAMEHHYLLTEPMPEVHRLQRSSTGTSFRHMIDFAGEIYARQEGQGILLGTYEQNNRPWSPNETPWDFVFQLLPHDLDRIAPELERGFAHFPAVGRAGIKKFVNGPFTFSPDGNPLVGPIKGMPRHVGGVRGDGRPVARWRRRPVVGQLDGRRRPARRHLGNGRCPLRRLGHACLHQRQGSRELLASVPHHVSQRGAAGGPPVAHHADLRPADGAQRGVGCRVRSRASAVVPGARRGADRERHVPPFQRVRSWWRRNRGPCASASVCRRRRTSPSTRSVARAPPTGCRACSPTRLPKVGRTNLTAMLNPQGRIVGEFSVSRIGPDEFFLFGSQAAEVHHPRWFLDHLPSHGARTDPLRGARVVDGRPHGCRASFARRAAEAHQHVVGQPPTSRSWRSARSTSAWHRCGCRG